MYWEDTVGFKDAGNQLSCGSCWAFSATAAIESGYAIKECKAVNKLSQQELLNCETDDMGCNGGLMDHAVVLGIWIHQCP